MFTVEAIINIIQLLWPYVYMAGRGGAGVELFYPAEQASYYLDLTLVQVNTSSQWKDYRWGLVQYAVDRLHQLAPKREWQ